MWVYLIANFIGHVFLFTQFVCIFIKFFGSGRLEFPNPSRSGRLECFFVDPKGAKISKSGNNIVCTL